MSKRFYLLDCDTEHFYVVLSNRHSH